ncbi:LysR substrate-binding domain-containing protein [Pseudosulfitobacter koreensis]|uniref:LysR substrate-binding domain-containing protein n=1 Tax=Pseudosulfitobacter koreensis TaxID=2968472 RepID=A0ABT1Z0X1_9RHOB|nr:LysR substrate-binding domain-containing protein [Pseudosulfitobacter koreense]MCR8826785.1 LysR substrate-binding domain-containing protein [Pseudosulfitobacter koreense]
MNTRALPPLNQLRAFEAAARHLSFTAAAGELNMTQSAVSQQIKSLEGYLGQPLFYRRPRALELTVTGLNYLPVVRDAFQTLSRGTRMLVDGDARDALQVQCNLTFATCWLAPRLPRLYARHPDLHLQINTAIWDPMERGDMADIEIRFLMAPPRDRPATRLTWDRFYPVCAPDYQVTLEDIARHRLFYCTAMLTTWHAWAEGTDLRPQKGPRVTHAQVLATALAAAEAGAGLAMAHDCAARLALDAGRLVRPFEGAVQMHEAYYLCIVPQAEDNAQAQAFAAWIKSEMAADYPLSGSEMGHDGTQA